MTLSTFLSFSTTAASNIDVNGIGILGSNPVENFDNAFRQLMAILRRDLDAGIAYVTKSGTYTAVLNDNNAFIRTTGALTLSLTAAATLGANWHLYVFADGGDVTIDPNGSETVNGVTTAIIPQGFDGFLICDGSGFRLVSSGIQGAYGQCQLSLSGGSLLLSRFNGKLLTINGAHQSVPSAGVTLAPTGLTPATLYYIYAYMSGTTMTLEASATAPATDTTTGMQVKNGDTTRTLVGMARPVTGPAFADSATQRLVVSRYNRTTKAAANFFTADRTTASASYVEMNSEIRVEFLAWGDEALAFSSSGGMSQNGTSAVGARISIDGTADWLAQSIGGGGNGLIAPVNASASFTPTQGYHYLTLLGCALGGSTGTFYGTNALLRCFVHAQIRG